MAHSYGCSSDMAGRCGFELHKGFLAIVAQPRGAHVVIAKSGAIPLAQYVSCAPVFVTADAGDDPLINIVKISIRPKNGISQSGQFPLVLVVT